MCTCVSRRALCLERGGKRGGEMADFAPPKQNLKKKNKNKKIKKIKIRTPSRLTHFKWRKPKTLDESQWSGNTWTQKRDDGGSEGGGGGGGG